MSSIATLGHHSKSINEETYWSGNQDQSVYAISKYGAEMEVWRGTQEGIPMIIVNPGVIIGQGFGILVADYYLNWLTRSILCSQWSYCLCRCERCCFGNDAIDEFIN